MLAKQPKRNKWSTPYEPVFYALCSIQGFQITARRVTDGRPVCRDASQFKLANEMINITDEPEVNEDAQLPPVVPDSEIPGSRAPPSVPPTTANAETLREPTNAEIPPEPKAEPTQGTEHDQPVDQPAVTRPSQGIHKPAYLKDYVSA